MENSEAMYRRPTVPVPPALPSISDYWPDAPHRIGPPADHYTDESTSSEVDALLRSGTREGTREGTRDSIGNGTGHTISESIGNGSQESGTGAQQRGRGRRRVALGIVLAVVLLGASGAVVLTLTRQADRPGATTAAPRPLDPAAAPVAPEPSGSPAASVTPKARPSAVAAPLEGRDLATFELVSDTTTIDLGTAELGADLYRISTPAAGSVLPRATNGDTRVRLFLDNNGKRGVSAVKVLLNADVRWSLKISGGVRTGVFDLGGARVDDLDFAGGAARIDLTVPRPSGTLPIRVSGGVNRFEVSTAQGVPVRVRTRRGAGQVKLDGRTDDGVARGASFLSPDWAASKNRIDLDAVAGVGTLRVGRG